MADETGPRATSPEGRLRWTHALSVSASDASGRLFFWVVALLVGVAAGYMAVGFRLAIDLLQTAVYGADNQTIHSYAAGLNPFLIFIIPVIGGLAVGLILWKFTPNARAASVSDVIHAAALRDSRVNRKTGLASAAASLITLSTGGSTGREGPVVHLAAVIASWVDDRLDHHGVTARDILGCAVAAAVSASFNAPIAGALFALEVVLRHYALHAFGPIVMASVAGAIISRIHMGEITTFVLPAKTLSFYQEIPAFMILGIVCGFVAVVLMRALFFAEDVADEIQEKAGTPVWIRPAVAGAMLGTLAIFFPHIIGVGYETTGKALTAQLPLWTAISFAAIKALAVAITYAGRMGGGVFSPSIMVGALTGLAFGQVATAIFPEMSGVSGLYALAGMGAVAAAVLGAPISTTLIVFELTGDYQAAIAVMVSVSLASVTAHRFVWKSFFLSQLMRAGVNLADGPEGYLPAQISLRRLMRIRGGEDCASDTACWALAEQGARLTRDHTLADALPIFDRLKVDFLPIVEEEGEPVLLGAVYHVDALKALNRALIEADREKSA
ncbi:MAG: chloride channel protein [Pseudomonadota bacterium]